MPIRKGGCMRSEKIFLQLLHSLSAKKVGSNWMAKCPGHNDNNPSLAIKHSSNGKILLFCHAGCTYAEVIKAIKSKTYKGEM